MKPDFGLPEQEIYLDNAATTIVAPEVIEAMTPYLEERYGNPETYYHLGTEAHEAVEGARRTVADVLDVDPKTIFFTSGGTEANNWAIKRVPGSVITSAVEHKSILKSAEAKEERLWETYVAPVDEFGTVNVDAIEAQTHNAECVYKLLSIQHVNNEVGTIQPIEKLAEIAKKHDLLFHVDAVQSFGKLEVDLLTLPIDMLTISAHKLHGPMGVGILYVKEGVPLEPFIHGGGQQDGMRAGTIPVHLLVGAAKAIELAWSHRRADMKKWEKQFASIMNTLGNSAKRNGHPTDRVPNIISLSFEGVEAVLMAGIMDEKYGVCVGTGAACSRHEPSHVLEAMGVSDALSAGTIRISLSHNTTDEEARHVTAVVHTAIAEAKDYRELI
jgi:cysteine desulfurase